jgi:hypothetical protein
MIVDAMGSQREWVSFDCSLGNAKHMRFLLTAEAFTLSKTLQTPTPSSEEIRAVNFGL